MPIRFRCAYCNQLMGIAHRKAGTVVRCPKCRGQVVVPIPEGEPPPVPSGPTDAPPVPPTHPGGVFEESDFEKVFQEPQALGQAAPGAPEPRGAIPTPGQISAAFPPNPESLQESQPRGMVLSPGMLTMLCVLVMLLIGIAFFVGVLLGRASATAAEEPAVFRCPPAEVIAASETSDGDNANGNGKSTS